ncbi:MAG TPA: type II secretion system protein [Pyrinomonadaceae bacterium]|nr:type II secretion system protein [Pyrinomonadaceae bacterium]
MDHNDERGSMDHTARSKGDAGFSLLELLIAMSLTIAMLGIAATALTTGYRIREREESVTDAVADAQRALNIMSREIANSGFNLSTNGIVAGDSDSTSIRIRSNLNKYDFSLEETNPSRNNVMDPGEDLKYFINVANNTDYLVRHDEFATGRKTTVLANRMDSLRVHYFAQKVTYTTADCDITSPSAGEVSPDEARYVVIALCVRIAAAGVPNTAGYQPASNVLLVSDVTLRNSDLIHY